MKENDFYVGYLPKAPRSMSKWLKAVIAGLLLLPGFVALMVAGNQHRFAATNFEYGQLTELTGVVSLEPVPRLIVEAGRDQRGGVITKSVLLVNFGKSGVETIFRNLEKELGRPLTNFEFNLRGTLIYGEGKTVFELTDQEASVLGHKILDKAYVPVKTVALGEQSFEGEIIDPKCYFGVMKPGFGKVHRSCAIRCIAGGISPVMATKNENGEKQFILLLADKGKTKWPLISRLAGKPITIKGELKQVDDWLVLHYDDQLLYEAASFPIIPNESDKLAREPKLLAGPNALDANIVLCN
ncbi:hypothetical protein QQ020_24595 [Fulvivirgaceae bacterium BMA12]|uniref:Uncharacterized protein n=1 Tax=Agaribacillus aureus TaxID=3051825 RepID=A0ABT8LDI7_9BACT|nr:hypothetical protein [Fulvivirgaceae bacterium BMA12]